MVSNALRIGLLPVLFLTLATGCDDDDNGSDTAANSGSTGQGSGTGDSDPSGGESGNAEGGSNSELEDIVDGAVELSEALSEVIGGTCDCWEGFGFASQEACEMAVEVEDLSFDRACLLDALSMDVDASIENFNCERPGLEELLTCITPALDACDIDTFSACTDVPEPDCAELPPEVDAAVDVCIGG